MAIYPADPHYLAEHPSGKNGDRLPVRTAEHNAVLPSGKIVAFGLSEEEPTRRPRLLYPAAPGPYRHSSP